MTKKCGRKMKKDESNYYMERVSMMDEVAGKKWHEVVRGS